MMKKDDKKKGRAGEFDVVIGSALRNMRKTHGVSQEAVADQLGVTFQQVQKYERGANRLSLANFVKMCSIFKTDPGQTLDQLIMPGASLETVGFAETEQADFNNDNALLLRDETGKLVKEYYKIRDPAKRQQILDIIKTFQ